MSVAAIQELLVLLTMKDGLSGPAGTAIASTKALQSSALGMGVGMTAAETKIGLVGKATTGAGQAISHLGGVVGGASSFLSTPLTPTRSSGTDAGPVCTLIWWTGPVTTPPRSVSTAGSPW